MIKRGHIFTITFRVKFISNTITKMQKSRIWWKLRALSRLWSMNIPLINTRYGFWHTGGNMSRVNELFKILTQGRGSNSQNAPDFNENGLKLHQLIQGWVYRMNLTHCVRIFKSLLTLWVDRPGNYYLTCKAEGVHGAPMISIQMDRKFSNFFSPMS